MVRPPGWGRGTALTNPGFGTRTGLTLKWSPHPDSLDRGEGGGPDPPAAQNTNPWIGLPLGPHPVESTCGRHFFKAIFSKNTVFADTLKAFFQFFPFFETQFSKGGPRASHPRKEQGSKRQGGKPIPLFWIDNVPAMSINAKKLFFPLVVGLFSEFIFAGLIPFSRIIFKVGF